MKDRALLAYFRERFPIVGAALLGIGFSLFAVGLSGEYQPFERNFLIQVSLLALLFVAFLLRQRASDEFKDLIHDTKNFPGRPLQRGLVSKRQLVVIGLVALAAELAIAGYISSARAFVLYLFVFAYSLLMLKEFFISEWLERHFNVYLALHQIVFVFFAAWFVVLFDTDITVSAVAWVGAFLAAMMSVEIARKFEIRKNPADEVVEDTYPAVWGEKNAKSILQLLIISIGILLSFAESHLAFAILSSVAALSLSLFDSHQSVYVQAITALHFLLLPGLGIIL